MRRHAPDGEPFPPDAFVFGNDVGERVKAIKKAWMTTVLKVHGHVPAWEKGGRNQLSAESRAAYRAINLKCHDLRREFWVTGTGVGIVAGQSSQSGALQHQPDFDLLAEHGQESRAGDSRERYEQQLAEARRDVALPGGHANLASPRLLEFDQYNMRLTCPEDLCRVLYRVQKQRLPWLQLHFNTFAIG